MRRILIIFTILFVSILAHAQFTLVSGTVVDPNGLPYANGTISPVLVLPGGTSPTLNGLPYTPPTGAANLDGTGSFTMRLGDNVVLLPALTTWNFTVCSAAGTVQPAIGTGSVCFALSVPITITGATQNISVQLNAAALPLIHLIVPTSTAPTTTWPAAVTTVYIIGNSHDLGYELPATAPTVGSNNAWGSLLARSEGALVGTNGSIGGAKFNDPGYANAAFAITPTASTATVFTCCINNYSNYAANGPEIVNGIQDEVTWLALPASAKVVASAMTLAGGGWSTSTLFGQTYELNATLNATATATVNGTVVYVGLFGNIGLCPTQAHILIDTIDQGAVSESVALGAVPMVARYPGLAPGNHTVQFKIVTGGANCFIGWVGGNQGTPQAPFVGIGSQLNGNPGGTNLTILNTFNGLMSAMVATLASDGLNVKYVNDFGAFTYATTVPNTLGPTHPNMWADILVGAFWYDTLTPAPTFPAATGTGGDAYAQAMVKAGMTPGLVSSSLWSLESFLANRDIYGSWVSNDINGYVTATKLNKITSFWDGTAARATVGNGVPFEVAIPAAVTAQAADVTATTIYPVPASGAGKYRVCATAKVTQQATTSSTVPTLNVVYTDVTDSVVTTIPFAAPIGAAVNPATSYGVSGCSGALDVKASTNIQFSTSGYVSVGATAMQFKYTVSVESQ